MTEIDTKLNAEDQNPTLAPLKNGVDLSKRIFDIVLFALSFCYIVVMWATGWNFLPLEAAALAAFLAAIIAIRLILNKGLPVFIWAAYLLIIAGELIFFLSRGAEGFLKALWWNLLLTAAPIGLGVLILFVPSFKKIKGTKILALIVAFLMMATVVVYALFMNLRLKPTVKSLKDGHDDYLDLLKNRTAKADAPNVLFILMDDLAFADLSCYSYLGNADATIKTPNIDSIADGGIYMENFYASAPVCTPSRFSALTGRYATRGYIDNVIFPTTVESTPYSPTHFINPYQFLNNVDGILGDEITIAEALQALNYDTSCIGKWNLGDYGEYLPTNQGFDYFYGSYYVNDMTPYNWVEETNGTAKEVRSHADNLDQSESTAIFTDKVVEQIEKSVDDGNKFFTYYATPWPHYPIYSNLNGNGKGDTTDDSYVACVEEFDNGVGKIIDALKEKGVYDDTLIIFTSDNGPGREGVTGALRGRKNTTFDGGMKVPMLASYPNGNLGDGDDIADSPYLYYNESGTAVNGTTKRIKSSAMLTDLFPTILSYAAGQDAPLPTDRIIDGVNLNTLWSGSLPSDYRVHDVLYYMKGGKVQAVQAAVQVDGATYDFKYYENVLTENSAFLDQHYKNYLFNLDTDPAEGYNLSMTHPETAAELNAKLNAFKEELKANRRGII